MKEINIDWIEKMEDGLVKKNPSTKMHLVEGLDKSIEKIEGDISGSEGRIGVIEKALPKKAEETELKRIEFSELSSTATGKTDETYTNVEWKDKSGSVYATSTLIDNILTIKYTADNKVIKWKLTFDEDGFPFKKELI